MAVLRTGSPQARATLTGEVDIARDRALVMVAQSGDRDAFDELYALYHRRLWRFCFKRLRDEHEAEDVVQEAFLRAWRALPGFGGERRFYPWLSVIASHLCTNVTRKRNRIDPAGDLHDKQGVCWEHCGEDRVLALHDSEVVKRTLSRLSPRYRLILDLRESRGWSYRRIAEHQGIGVAAVESLLWRAREALKREFAVQSGEGGVGAIAVLLTVRRWLRTVQVACHKGAGLIPTTASAITGSAATGIAVAVVSLGTLIPNHGPAASGTPVAQAPGRVLITLSRTSLGVRPWHAVGETAPGHSPTMAAAGAPTTSSVPAATAVVPELPSSQAPPVEVPGQPPLPLIDQLPAVSGSSSPMSGLDSQLPRTSLSVPLRSSGVPGSSSEITAAGA